MPYWPHWSAAIACNILSIFLLKIAGGLISIGIVDTSLSLGRAAARDQHEVLSGLLASFRLLAWQAPLVAG